MEAHHDLGDELTQPGESRPMTPPIVDVDVATAETGAGESLGSAPTMGSGARDRLGPAIPDRIGRYLILDRLGAGGMGVVLAAYDPELDRKVAIKLLRAAPGADASARLLREAQALARLSHPNVVQIHDAGAHGQQIFLAMELVAGDNLRRWLDGERRPWRSILRVFVDAGRGLAAAHAVGIVHRDFKPENVLIGGDGRARVADFGLARQLRDDEVASPGDSGLRARGPTSALDVSLTMSGTVLGTPAYMSPEHLDGARADARSDVFSYCVALYEALYGQRPFRGDTLSGLLIAIREGTVREPPGANAVPRRIFAILRRGLAHAPEDRWPGMEALLAALTFDPDARRRRVAVGGALMLGASAATYALGLAIAPAEAAPCGGGEAAIADLWGDDARDELRRAFAATIPAATLGERAIAGLDTYADAWVAARRDACLAHQRGDDSEAIQRARVRCLDRRRSALDGALRLLRDVRPGDDIVRVVAGLPAIDACARVDALLAAPEDPRDPAQEAAIAAIEATLDDARARADAGRLDEANATIDAAIAAAEAAGARGVLAQARLAHARVASTRQVWPDAAASLRLALADAIAADDAPTAAEAVARLLHARALAGESPALVLADAPVARSIVDRVGAGGFAQRRLHADLGLVQLVAGDLDRARADLVAATDDLAAVVDADPFEAANFLRSLAAITDDPAAREGAFDRADAILRRTLGGDHPELFSLELFRGRTSLDLDEATRRITAACDGYARVGAPDPEREPTCATCGLLLGGVALERGDAADAIARFEEAATCDPGPATSPTSQARIDTRRDLARAQAERLRGRPELAIAAAERTLAALEPHVSADTWWLELERAEAWLVIGEARLDRGELDAARATLERAYDALARHGTKAAEALPRFQRARAAARLAELLGDEGEPDARARARGLIAEAIAFHRRRGPAGHGEAARLERWLDAHPPG